MTLLYNLAWRHPRNTTSHDGSERREHTRNVKTHSIYMHNTNPQQLVDWYASENKQVFIYWFELWDTFVLQWKFDLFMIWNIVKCPRHGEMYLIMLYIQRSGITLLDPWESEGDDCVRKYLWVCTHRHCFDFTDGVHCTCVHVRLATFVDVVPRKTGEQLTAIRWEWSVLAFDVRLNAYK